MKRYIFTVSAIAAMLLPLIAGAAKDKGNIQTQSVKVHRSDSMVTVSADIVLDSLQLNGNHQFFISPVIECGDSLMEVLPAVMVNGRNMHIAYERGILRNLVKNYNIYKEVRRYNGQPQTINYITTIPMQKWMMNRGTGVRFMVDTCGCGTPTGKSLTPAQPVNLMPTLLLSYLTPPVTELPVSVHEGQARVQFEVDKTILHTEPYTCRNGQKIDNRAQLQIIDDSVRYALSDPNVEISGINITGYASPESPYVHNEYLATNRSRALSEYLAQKYNLPSESSTYGSVPENWGEFREQVLNATDISEQQRRDLLELIDRPAYGASDYDAKERELKTSPKFAQLYRTKILPEWFPRLRATKFAITTRLKPLSDEKLAEVIEKTPQLMSLNQMFRVARLYPEGSQQFNNVIDIALKYYPDSPVANTNAAITAIKAGDYAKAAACLQHAGDNPEADNARGVMEAYQGDFKKAAEYFRKAGNYQEAVRNLQLISE